MFSGDEVAGRAGDTGGVVWELGLVPSAGNTFLLPVTAGHLCSVAPEAQLGPTEMAQDIFSLNLGKSLLPGRVPL